MSRIETSSPEETRALGRDLARRLPCDGVLLLYGELGTGKTVLAQGVAEGLGLDPTEVQSPSYTLIREHEVPEGDTDRAVRRLVHVDLYRLEPAQLVGLGLEEVLSNSGIKVVEWAERLDFPVPAAWRLEIARGETATDRVILIDEPNEKQGERE